MDAATFTQLLEAHAQLRAEAERASSPEDAVINAAYDELTPGVPEAAALDDLLGRAAFRIATDLGLADPLGAGCDAVRAVQVFVAERLLREKACEPRGHYEDPNDE